MAKAMETSLTLEELRIACDLGSEGCASLASMLRVNTSLKNFTLELNSLENDNKQNNSTQGNKNNEEGL